MPNFLLEVGTEELPADFVSSAIAQWQEKIPHSLNQHLLKTDKLTIYGTPRRLAVFIEGLEDKQPDRKEEIKGPPVSAAFKNNQPTKAATGFARKQGVEVEDLTIKETDKGAFVFVNKEILGRNIKEILPELAPTWITELVGKRFMRWSDGDLRFPRPIRWLVTLIDTEILPLELVNGSNIIKSDRISQGHRVLHPEIVSISQATDYESVLRDAYVEVNPSQRRQIIETEVISSAKKLQGEAQINPELLEEVTNLVEWPTAVTGKFDQEFLQLPPEVITTVMVTHQRYFSVKDSQGKLLPNFITISNGDPKKSDIIAAGNERVIRARLADGQFFYKEDCGEHLDSYIPQLENVTFQEDLGSMREKVDRILDTSLQIAEQLEVSETERNDIESTALLCKADLVTQMVYEFPELQGVMGQKYALVSGESTIVAQGILEHYLPKTADDEMPQSITGQVVGIADRLDTLISIFGLEMIPTGSSDPFALRRAANAIINIIWFAKLPINLAQLLESGSQDFVTAHPESQSPLTNLYDFFSQRLRTLLQDEINIDYDLVNAVLPENDSQYLERALNDVLDLRDRAVFLQNIRNNGTLAQIYETVNRSTRLAAKGSLDTESLEPQDLVLPELFEKSSEREFYQGLLELIPQTQKAESESNYQLLVDGLVTISPIVSEFFDGDESVLVMAENLDVQRNRLNLLGLLRNHARVLADFGEIVKS